MTGGAGKRKISKAAIYSSNMAIFILTHSQENPPSPVLGSENSLEELLLVELLVEVDVLPEGLEDTGFVLVILAFEPCASAS